MTFHPPHLNMGSHWLVHSLLIPTLNHLLISINPLLIANSFHNLAWTTPHTTMSAPTIPMTIITSTIQFMSLLLRMIYGIIWNPITLIISWLALLILPPIFLILSPNSARSWSRCAIAPTTAFGNLPLPLTRAHHHLCNLMGNVT